MAQLVAAHLSTPPPQPSLTQPDVPAQIDPVIATGMAKDPDDRYATTVELADAARDAITTPIPGPQTAPATPEAPPGPAAETLAAAQPADPTLPATQQHRAGVPAPGASGRQTSQPASTDGDRRRGLTRWLGRPRNAGIAAAVVLVVPPSASPSVTWSRVRPRTERHRRT